MDAVIISADRMPQDLFYVAATRGRESLTVITSDKEQLREAIGVSGERQSASELARRSSPLPGEELGRLYHAFEVTNEQPAISQQVQQQVRPEERISQEVSHEHGISISM